MFDKIEFTSTSGIPLDWKIECDDMTAADWRTIAQIIGDRVKFGSVEGVPEGGVPLARALMPYRRHGPLLIVDDVLTTGQSMERIRDGRHAIGIVLFARGECPAWIHPIFTLSPWATSPRPLAVVPLERVCRG